MPKPSSSRPTPSTTEADAPGTGSTQQIWLAGLGALAQAQAQGTKAFEALVSDGLKFQHKTQTETQQRLKEATERLTHLAQDFGQQASGRVDRLEQMFEERVARALQRLGMPSQAELEALKARIEALEAAAQKSAKTAATGPASPSLRKTTAKTDASPTTRLRSRTAAQKKVAPKTASTKSSRSR